MAFFSGPRKYADAFLRIFKTFFLRCDKSKKAGENKVINAKFAQALREYLQYNSS